MSTATPSSRPGGAASLVGTTVGGRYKLVRVIGEGGMSAVYEGEHVHMHKPVAVKVLSPQMTHSAEAVERFRREAMAAGRIDHPNVAAATDFGELEDKSFFLVLELVHGKTLRETIGAGRLEPRRALHVARQIASALGRAHSLGIVHRDLKPENVMLTTRGDEEDVVKILDFGIAKIPVAELTDAPSQKDATPLTQLGMVYGTPEYMSPEQAMGKAIDARADLYALGVILFEMLAGVRPWDDENRTVLLGKKISQPVPTVAERAQGVSVPVDIEGVARKLMAKEPEDRYARAEDALAAMDAILAKPPEPVALPPQLKTLPLPAAMAKPPRAPLLDRIEAKLPLERLPLRLPPRQKLYVVFGAAGFAVIVALTMFVLVLVVVTGHGTKSKNDAGAAIDHKARCLDAASAGDHASVVREASLWASGPHEDSEEVAHAVAEAASDQETAAFDLLEHQLGAPGADALYDLAYGASTSPTIAAHAKRALSDEAVQSHMSQALGVTLAIRGASNICDAKTQYFTQAAALGDARTEAVLKPYLKRGGCGRRGRVDCHPCLRTGNDSVEKTVAAIRARLDGGV